MFRVEDVIWLKLAENNYSDLTLKEWCAAGLPKLQGNSVLGIDPGLNFGVAFYVPQDGFMMAGSGHIPATDVKRTIRSFLHQYTQAMIPTTVYLEGSSYEPYGGENLERVRSYIEFVVEDMGYKIVRVAPASARKSVFGNGKIVGKNIEAWKSQHVNGNALDAAVLAWAAGGFKFDT